MKINTEIKEIKVIESNDCENDIHVHKSSCKDCNKSKYWGWTKTNMNVNGEKGSRSDWTIKEATAGMVEGFWNLIDEDPYLPEDERKFINECSNVEFLDYLIRIDYVKIKFHSCLK